MSLTETLSIVTGLLRRPALDAKTPAAPPPPPPPPPVEEPRLVEARVEFRGLLWHPVLGVQERAGLVVSAKAGLPHCARCDKALALVSGTQETWSCAACGGFTPGRDVDFSALDGVVSVALGGFLREHPAFAPAPGLNAPTRALQAA